MVFYQCFRCGYSSNDKSKIRLHINRKNTCSNKLNDIKIDVCKNEILQGLSYEEYKSNLNEFKSIPIDSKSIPNDSKSNPNQSKKECKFCNKIYEIKDKQIKLI